MTIIRTRLTNPRAGIAAAYLFAALSASFLLACDDDKVVPPVGQKCIQNSECKNPLSCTFGLCHEECTEARDCPKGQTCITGENDEGEVSNVCQLETESRCIRNSDCDDKLVCAPDFQCRNECEQNKDCTTKTQQCVEHVCAEPDDVVKDSATGELMLKPRTPPKGFVDAGTKQPDAGKTPVAGAGGKPGADAGTVPPKDSGMDATTPGDAGPPEVEGITCNRTIVRQGEGGITVTVVGKDLVGPKDIKLGDLKTTLKSGNTDTKFEVTVSVPHGVELGPKNFSFSTAGGSGSKDALVTVSAITAAPTGKDDNHGTSDNPFRSFKQALNVSDMKDTIQLKDGTYDTATSGEDWMLQIPDGVVISGEGPNTKLIGPGAQGGSVSANGLTFKNSGTVKNLTLGFFQYNAVLDKPDQKVTLEGVELTGSRYYGIYVETAAKKAELTLKNTVVKDCNGVCLYLYAEGAKITTMGGKITSLNSYAIQSYGVSTTITIDGTEISGGGAYDAITASQQEGTNLYIKNAKFLTGLQYSSNSTTPKGELSLEATTFDLSATAMTGSGVDFQGAKLTITGCELKGGYYGVQQKSGEAKIRNTAFKDYTYYGYFLTQGKLDMGTDAEPGGNSFQSSEASNKYGLYDQRTSVAVDPITVSGTMFNGWMPPTGTVEKTASVDPGMANRFDIYATGNKIVFY